MLNGARKNSGHSEPHEGEAPCTTHNQKTIHTVACCSSAACRLRLSRKHSTRSRKHGNRVSYPLKSTSSPHKEAPNRPASTFFPAPVISSASARLTDWTTAYFRGTGFM